MTLARYAVFYHIWSPPATDLWRLLVDEQLKRIETSGLSVHADVYCCISGPQFAAIQQFLSYHPWLKILKATPDEDDFEGLTLNELYDACAGRDREAVAYIHTKGMGYYARDIQPHVFRAVNSWRHLMEWGVIDRWVDATSRLGQADVVGTNYSTLPWPHMKGNFWWAQASYIRSLPRPHRLPPAAELQIDPRQEQRIAYEKWIGLNRPRVFSFMDFPARLPGIPGEFGEDMYSADVLPHFRRHGM